MGACDTPTFSFHDRLVCLVPGDRPGELGAELHIRSLVSKPAALGRSKLAGPSLADGWVALVVNASAKADQMIAVDELAPI